MPLERQIAAYRLNRIVRTPYSEVYLIWDNQTRIGQMDIHYAHQTVYATLVLEHELDVAAEEGLIAQFDEQVVQAYLPNLAHRKMTSRKLTSNRGLSQMDSRLTLEHKF